MLRANGLAAAARSRLTWRAPYAACQHVARAPLGGVPCARDQDAVAVEPPDTTAICVIRCANLSSVGAIFSTGSRRSPVIE